MKLQFDVPTTARKTHALVVGVSSYPYLSGPQQTDLGASFQMTNLSAAAASAADIASWLITEFRGDAPLATLRILLSPADGEAIEGPAAALLSGPCPATRSAFEKDIESFFEECREPDSVAFVYVAGHGVQLTKRGATLLLHDAAGKPQPQLYGAADIVSCHRALDGPQYAQTQFWFFDACRERLGNPGLETMAGAYTLSEPAGEAASSTLFLASSTREASFAVPGRRTLFSQALRAGFGGTAAEGPTSFGSDEWRVTTFGLLKSLNPAVKKLAHLYSADQNVEVVKLKTNTVVHRLRNVPDVPVRLSLVPEEAAASARLSLWLNGTEPRIEDSVTWPFVDTVQAGIYKFRLAADAPYEDIEFDYKIEPPELDQSLLVGLV